MPNRISHQAHIRDTTLQISLHKHMCRSHNFKIIIFQKMRSIKFPPIKEILGGFAQVAS